MAELLKLYAIEQRNIERGVDVIERAIAEAVQEENEACAHIAAEWGEHPQPKIARAIRARKVQP